MPGAIPILLTAVALFYAALGIFQERLIYFPRHYLIAPEQLPAPLEPLPFTTTAGAETAIYIPPRSNRRARLWLTFGGNAMTALNWADWALAHPDPDAAFLLIDYPGYGFSRGKPSRANIAATNDAAFLALAARLQLTPEQLAVETHLLGHSIGAAVALEFAVRHPARGIVLTAPFTTLSDMASRLYSPLARPLVREAYDNAARLAELQPRGLSAVILHGRDDEIISFDFGERLAKGAPWVKFVPIAGGHHNDLYEVAAKEIRAAMLEVSGVHAATP